MQAHLISNTGSNEAAHYTAIAREELRQRAMIVQQSLVLNEVQQGVASTCNAFASHCSTWLDKDLAYALCLARILKDDALLQMALTDLDQHIAKTLPEFCEEEVELRIKQLQQRAADAALEACHG
ncbi:TPA: hypothetical protein SL272_000861 [Pseudomonas aeruginosa]|nr:hypothetical protein [Pseudomonas aeruginosa]